MNLNQGNLKPPPSPLALLAEVAEVEIGDLKIFSFRHFAKNIAVRDTIKLI